MLPLGPLSAAKLRVHCYLLLRCKLHAKTYNITRLIPVPGTWYLYNILRKMTFIPAFSEPQSHWPRTPPPSALGQSGGAARAAGVAPRGNPTISPHTGRIGPRPRFSNPSIHLQLRQRGDETVIPRVEIAPHGVETPTPPVDRWLAGARR